jgi:hypothetical protein
MPIVPIAGDVVVFSSLPACSCYHAATIQYGGNKATTAHSRSKHTVAALETHAHLRIKIGSTALHDTHVRVCLRVNLFSSLLLL